MEDEENRGLIHKKASKDQLVTFSQFSFGALSLLSLSLYHTLGYLEFPWITLRGCGILGFWSKKEKEEKGHKRTSEAATIARFSCRYQVACMFSSLVLACTAYA